MFGDKEMDQSKKGDKKRDKSLHRAIQNRDPNKEVLAGSPSVYGRQSKNAYCGLE